MTRECRVCKKNFKIKIHNQLMCSDECTKIWRKDYNKKYHDEYYKKNTEYVKQKVKEYRENNKKKVAVYKKEYFNNNKDAVNKRLRRYKKERQSKDENYYLTRTFRRRIYMSFKKQSSKKAYKSIELLGCTIQELKIHLEGKFTKGMSWNNYGVHGWHIDHIKPCASFNLTVPEQQKECFNYKNLQPLWAIDNIKKGAKIL